MFYEACWIALPLTQQQSYVHGLSPFALCVVSSPWYCGTVWPHRGMTTVGVTWRRDPAQDAGRGTRTRWWAAWPSRPYSSTCAQVRTLLLGCHQHLCVSFHQDSFSTLFLTVFFIYVMNMCVLCMYALILLICLYILDFLNLHISRLPDPFLISYVCTLHSVATFLHALLFMWTRLVLVPSNFSCSRNSSSADSILFSVLFCFCSQSLWRRGARAWTVMLEVVMVRLNSTLPSAP